MLNRRILRIKAFEAVYSYAENPSMTLAEAERQLEASCEAVRDLYLYMLSIIGPLTGEARSRIEGARSKFNPTEEERNPNLKFVENMLSPLLDTDPDFTRIIKRKKFSWEQNDAFLRSLYENVREKAYFKTYMASPDRSLEEDARLFVRIFTEEFEDSRKLEEILEDMSIYWNDGLGYALGCCCRTIAELGKGGRWTLPDLPAGDAGFARGLLRTAYANLDVYRQKVADCTPKWDKNRICITDLALISCGLAEHAACPDTPAGVVINEYVEISKYYSTPESSAFVNGLLDKLIKTNN